MEEGIDMGPVIGDDVNPKGGGGCRRGVCRGQGGHRHRGRKRGTVSPQPLGLSWTRMFRIIVVARVVCIL